MDDDDHDGWFLIDIIDSDHVLDLESHDGPADYDHNWLWR